MASFFDKASDVLKNTANEISDKAKEYSEVSSLNVQIRNQEKVIDSAYLEIGKLYFEAHKDALEDPYLEQIMRIKSANDTAESLRKTVAAIKGKY